MKILLIVVKLFVLFAPTMSFAVDCVALDRTGVKAGEIIPDTGSGRDIVGKGRLQFYLGPDLRCKIPGLFVIRGDMIFDQVDYNGFSKVAFIALKKTDKKDVVAWVVSSRLTENGAGIVPGSHFMSF